MLTRIRCPYSLIQFTGGKKSEIVQCGNQEVKDMEVPRKVQYGTPTERSGKLNSDEKHHNMLVIYHEEI